MSFRRHYGGSSSSYGSSLVASPIASSYSSSRVLSGGYSSPYATPLYSSPHSMYGSYGKGVRTRSSSLPRDVKERSRSRHTSLSRGASPPRSSHIGDSSTSSVLLDLTSSALNRHHSFSGSRASGLSASSVPRSYSSRDYSSYATAKALARAARSKSLGSGSISSLSSGYGSRSGVSVTITTLQRASCVPHHHHALTYHSLPLSFIHHITSTFPCGASRVSR